MSEQKSDLITLGGLWINTTKSGKKYMSGNLTPTVKIMIFKVDDKKTDKHPDYTMCLAPIKKQDNKGGTESTGEYDVTPPEQSEDLLPF